MQPCDERVILERDKCKDVAYADNIVLNVSSRFVDTIRYRVQVALSRVSGWVSDRGLG